MTGTTTPERKVPTRRISFDESLQDLPKHFAAENDLVGSHLMAVLSGVFPDGEDFFVRSVRAAGVTSPTRSCPTRSRASSARRPCTAVSTAS